MSIKLNNVHDLIGKYQNHSHPAVRDHFSTNHSRLIGEFEREKEHIIESLKSENLEPHEIQAVLSDIERAYVRHLSSIENHVRSKGI